VVAMDAPGPTFRHEMFADYKANRPPMPEELPPQIQRIEEIMAAMRIPVLRVSGYEADDIIGTLTQQASQKGLQVYICSKDKDLEQLINDKVAMYDPKKDIVTDVAALKENKGIQPEQVVDVLALQGDSIDNIPGVADVGPKTALQWISKYGSLDNLIENADEIKGKRGENLRASLEQLHLSRLLATLNCAVPLNIDLADFTVKQFNAPALQQIFQKLNFRKLLESISNQAGVQPTGETAGPTLTLPGPNGPADYILVDSDKAFDGFLKKLAQQNIFAIDTETTGLNPVAAKLVGMSFSWNAGQGFYLPVKAPLGRQHLDAKKTLKQLKPILENPHIKKIGQNIKYDMIILRRAGVQLKGVEFDTMVASYVLDSSRTSHKLDNLAMDHLGHETIKLEELIGKGKNQLTFDLVDTQQACDYAAEDADITWRLGRYFDTQLTDPDLKKLFTEVEMPLVEVLAEMEFQGVALDSAWLRKLSTRFSKRLDELTEKIHEQAKSDFNIDSPKQLAEILFERIGLKPVKKTKTGFSTDQEVLETLKWLHPVPALVLEYRQLSKLKNTYVDKLPSMICADTGRVHASFNQSVTATGRLSSSDPNLQNIPIRTEEGQEIRRAFVAQKEDNVILAADYSQIELRLLAHFSGDKALRQAFEEGQDIHRFVAAQVNDIPLDEVDKTQRGKAKAVNFGIIYGQSAYGLSRGIGIPVREAQEFIDAYFARYGQIKTFMDEVINQAAAQGYVKTILGRRRAIPELASSNASRRKQGERLAVNTVIQGSAADMIKLAMIHIHQRIQKENLDLKMILQVHDELVFELPENKLEPYTALIRNEMKHPLKLDVPIIVDIAAGQNWLECK
ncbi:MAG: DNA polymerase I, partial [Sedimentisphaerales bacterium]|nr:DNA polymerase I [Sedimentisphaerales bacterium]